MKKIAYLILAHNDPQHLSRLCASLEAEYCDIYIHINNNCELSDFTEIVQGENICFLEERVVVSWADMSMTNAQNLLMEAALLKSDDYSHLVFLSGSCYPIKKQSEIHAELTSNPSREYIKYVDMRCMDGHHRQVSQKWFKTPYVKNSAPKPLVLLDKAIRRVLNKLRLKNAFDENLVPYIGSPWSALTVDCCKYIVKYRKDNPAYYKMNKMTFANDEHFYHTIIGNSAFNEKADGVQPPTGWNYKLANLHIIHHSMTKWYTIDDWEEIRDSSKFFVRKVRTLDGESLVDKIDAEALS